MHDEALADDGRPDFSSLLASAVHDMKNSLGVVLNSVEELAQECGGRPGADRVSRIRHETRRAHGHLIRLLALYKAERRLLGLNVAEHPVSDFIEDCLLGDKPLLDARSIEAVIDCAEDLYWCFDHELVAGVLGNALDNALRYARSRVLVAAGTEDGCLRLMVSDDGPGYAPALTGAAAAGHGRVSFAQGGTGLGLYFSAMVARLHKRNGRAGRIELANGGGLGGACFSLFLP